MAQMKVVVLGPPGVGKGTIASMLSKKHNLPHISTGDIFKEAIKSGTKLGQSVKSIVESGNLVPDELVTDIIKERLSKEDAQKGFFLDGYPRTVEQAKNMDGFSKPDLILNFSASTQIIVDRLSGRRVCSKCGTIYHIKNSPPKKEGTCDKCKGSLIRRKDDEKEVILNRLTVYEKQTKPLIDYYSGRKSFANIDSSYNIEEINKIIKQCETAISKVKKNG